MDGQTRRRAPNDDGHKRAYEDPTNSKQPRLVDGRPNTRRKWSSGNVEEFLSFEPTEIPRWRKETKTTDAPSISEMLKDIVQYKETYTKLKEASKEDDRKKIHRWLLTRFLCTIQKEEEIGVQEETLTESLMEDIDTNEATIGGQESMESRLNETFNKQPGNSSESSSLELQSIDLDEIDVVHEKIVKKGNIPAKSRRETINLYLAYKHIKDELRKSMDSMAGGDTQTQRFNLISETHNDKGFIEVESLIKHTHHILMKGVIEDGTPPGNFSTNSRTTTFKDKTHEYPKFENVVVAHVAVQTLVDKVNEIIESIRQKNASEEEKAKLYFKCSSLFLFCFLTLHPFGDGNGRLARLLSSYNLLTFSPFLTPIYNVFSPTRQCDYVQALVDARNSLGDAQTIFARDEAINLTIKAMHQKPSDLCSMLIESNWTVWRQLLVKLGDKDIKLYQWEIDTKHP